MATMNLLESMNHGADTYMYLPRDGCTEIKTTCCPCFNTKVEYAAQGGAGQKLAFSNKCTGCCCPWEVWVGNSKVGDTVMAGCCENGVCYACCPCFTCSGTVTLQNFRDGTGEPRYTIRRQLYPCWCPVEACARLLCLPCVCCMEQAACCCDAGSLVAGNNAAVTTEQVFGPSPGGLKSSLGANDPGRNDPVGEISIVESIQCNNCCPVRKTMNFKAELANEGGNPRDTLLLSLLPMQYRGLTIPVSCFALSPLPHPATAWFSGRKITSKRMPYGEAFDEACGMRNRRASLNSAPDMMR
jgi:hypothetical protein